MDDKKTVILPEQAVPMLETRFVKLYDLQYQPGAHYYDATRRRKEDLIAIKSDDEFRAMLPDAVTCFVIVVLPDGERRLLTFYEYRYPAGQYLLSVPAGLLDESDKSEAEPLLSAARREIREETGLVFGDGDTLRVLNPLVFSTPGLTDECNALVAGEIHVPDESALNHDGIEGSEKMADFRLLSRDEAKSILQNGRDEYGNFYSLYTFAALQYFLSTGEDNHR